MSAKEIGHQSNSSGRDELIGLVYDAVLNPSLWPDLLEKMNHYLHVTPDSLGLNEHEIRVQREYEFSAIESHFKRAVNIQQKVSQLESVTQALCHVLNRLPVGVMLVRRDATMIVSNQLASDAIETGKHLSVQHGQLLADSTLHTRQLHHLIRGSFSNHASPDSHDTAKIMNIGVAGQETSVWVTASTSLHPALPAAEALAAVFMYSAKMQRDVPLAAFIAKFHVSPAESRLIQVMLNGCHTLNDAADYLAISKHTARAQMKTIFNKTDCNSQIELMKKILISPAAMMSDQGQDAVVMQKHLRTAPNNQAYLSMHLHDGRRLVWKEFGASDGKPVMVFHSLTGAHPDYDLAQSMGIRLIVPERPGAYGSDPLHGRSFLDWADDVQQLADHLGLERFSLIGYSAGTPYVLACVEKIPHRIHHITLVSAMAPVRSVADLRGMIPLNYTAMRLGHQSPELMVDFMRVFLKELEENPESYFNHVAGDQPDEDKSVLHEGQIKFQFIHAFQAAAKENFQQLCDEVALCASDWPVDIAGYEGKVAIWHGLDDPLVPIAMGRRIAAMFEKPRVYFLEKHGNYLAYSHWQDILSELNDAEPSEC